MTVRAKVKCSVEIRGEGPGRSYEFYAVHSGSEENKKWAKYTPGLQLKITIDNPEAQVFEPGKEYFLDFSPAEG